MEFQVYGLDDPITVPDIDNFGDTSLALSQLKQGDYGEQMGYIPALSAGLFGEAGRGLLRGTLQRVQGYANTMGMHDLQAATDMYLQTNQQLYPGDRKGMMDYIVNTGASAVGQNAPSLIVAGLMGMAGMPPIALASMFAADTYMMEYGQTLDEIRSYTDGKMTPEGQLMQAFTQTALKSIIEVAIGPEYFAAKFMGRGGVKIGEGFASAMAKTLGVNPYVAWGKTALWSAIGEGSDEVIQQRVDDFGRILRGNNDLTTIAEYGKIALDSFIGGAFLGIAPGGYQAWNIRKVNSRFYKVLDAEEIELAYKVNGVDQVANPEIWNVLEEKLTQEVGEFGAKGVTQLVRNGATRAAAEDILHTPEDYIKDMSMLFTQGLSKRFNGDQMKAFNNRVQRFIEAKDNEGLMRYMLDEVGLIDDIFNVQDEAYAKNIQNLFGKDVLTDDEKTLIDNAVAKREIQGGGFNFAEGKVVLPPSAMERLKVGDIETSVNRISMNTFGDIIVSPVSTEGTPKIQAQAKILNAHKDRTTATEEANGTREAARTFNEESNRQTEFNLELDKVKKGRAKKTKKKTKESPVLEQELVEAKAESTLETPTTQEAQQQAPTEQSIPFEITDDTISEDIQGLERTPENINKAKQDAKFYGELAKGGRLRAEFMQNNGEDGWKEVLAESDKQEHLAAMNREYVSAEDEAYAETINDTTPRVRLGNNPTPHTVVRKLLFDKNTDLEGEEFYEIRNDRTGELQIVEKSDISPIGDTTLDVEPLRSERNGKAVAQWSRTKEGGLATFYEGAKPEDVVHEWFHHIMVLELIPTRLLNAIHSAYAYKQGGERKKSEDYYEDAVDGFMSYIQGHEIVESKVAEGFNLMSEIMNDARKRGEVVMAQAGLEIPAEARQVFDRLSGKEPLILSGEALHLATMLSRTPTQLKIPKVIPELSPQIAPVEAVRIGKRLGEHSAYEALKAADSLTEQAQTRREAASAVEDADQRSAILDEVFDLEIMANRYNILASEASKKFNRNNPSLADRIATGLRKEADTIEGMEGNVLERVKAVKQLRGLADKYQRESVEQATLFSKRVSDLGFYSELENQVDDMNFKAIPAKDLLARIKKISKQEERDDLGIEPWLEEREGKVTKEEVLDFIRSGGPQLQEVVKEDDVQVPPEWTVKYDEDDSTWILQDSEGVLKMQGHTRESAIEAWKEDQRQLLEDKTKFGQHQLPGGENYREFVLTLPPSDDIEDPSNWDEAGELMAKYNIPGDVAPMETDEYAFARIGAEIRRKNRPSVYTSSHWNEANVLLHFRLNDRTGPNGERILFIEEIQSDWHQQGRKEGYRGDLKARALELVISRGEVNGRQNYDFWIARNINGEIEDYIPVRDYDADDGSEISKEEATKRLRERVKDVDSRIPPNAPFKKSWAMLGMKRVLRLAVDEGYDSVAWTDGEVQNERYDLSKHVSYVEYKKVGDGRWDLEVQTLDHNSDPIEFPSQTESDLESTIGKDVTRRIIDDEGEVEDKTGYREEWKRLSGNDLKVGGEGMKGFYDEILPIAVNKFVKKMGGKVGTVEIETGISTTDIGAADSAVMDELGISSDPVSRMDTKEAWNLPITDQMRSEISGGVTLYSKRSEPLKDTQKNRKKLRGQLYKEINKQRKAEQGEDYTRFTQEEFDAMSDTGDRNDLTTTELNALLPKSQEDAEHDKKIEQMAQPALKFMEDIVNKKGEATPAGQGNALEGAKWRFKRIFASESAFGLHHFFSLTNLIEIVQGMENGALRDVFLNPILAVRKVQVAMFENAKVKFTTELFKEGVDDITMHLAKTIQLGKNKTRVKQWWILKAYLVGLAGIDSQQYKTAMQNEDLLRFDPSLMEEARKYVEANPKMKKLAEIIDRSYQSWIPTLRNAVKGIGIVFHYSPQMRVDGGFALQEPLMQENIFPSPQRREGESARMTLKRKEMMGRVVFTNPIEEYNSWINAVTTYIAKRDTMNNLTEVLTELKPMFDRLYGANNKVYSILATRFKRELYYNARIEPMTPAEVIVQKARRNAMMAILSLKIPVSILQTLSGSNALGYIPGGPTTAIAYQKNFFKIFGHFQKRMTEMARNKERITTDKLAKGLVIDGVNWYEIINKRDPAQLGAHADAELADPMRGLSSLKIPGVRYTIGEVGMFPIQHNDLVTRLSAWITDYTIVLGKAGQKYGEEQGQLIAAQHASRNVHKTQPAANVHERTPAQIGNEFERIFFTFTGFTMTAWQSMISDVAIPALREIKAGDIKGLYDVMTKAPEGDEFGTPAIKKFAYAMILPAMLIGFIRRRRKPTKEEFWQDVMLYPISMTPLIGPTISKAISWDQRDASISPVAFEFMNKLMAVVHDLGTGDVSDKTIRDLIASMSLLSGFPTQINQSLYKTYENAVRGTESEDKYREYFRDFFGMSRAPMPE